MLVNAWWNVRTEWYRARFMTLFVLPTRLNLEFFEQNMNLELLSKNIDFGVTLVSSQIRTPGRQSN